MLLFSGPKKQLSKIMKSLDQLYSSYSSEIVDVLLKYLLKTLRSSELVEHTEHASLGPTIKIILADWKGVLLRFWDKEPELILNFLKEVLIKIETQEAVNYEEGKYLLSMYLHFSIHCFGGVQYLLINYCVVLGSVYFHAWSILRMQYFLLS